MHSDYGDVTRQRPRRVIGQEPVHRVLVALAPGWAGVDGMRLSAYAGAPVHLVRVHDTASVLREVQLFRYQLLLVGAEPPGPAMALVRRVRQEPLGQATRIIAFAADLSPRMADALCLAGVDVCLEGRVEDAERMSRALQRHLALF